MDKTKFEHTLLDLGFERQEAKSGKGYNGVTMPYWFTLKQRNTTCHTPENMSCPSYKTHMITSEGTKTNCSGCRTWWYS